MTSLSLLTLCLYSAAFSFLGIVQAPNGNPGVAAARSLGIRGLGSYQSQPGNPARFTPSKGRIYVAGYLKDVFEDETERSSMAEAIEQLLRNFESTAAEKGYPNDSAAALAFSTSMLYATATGREPDDAGFLALVPRLQGYLVANGIASATDKQKQELYEWSLCAAGVVIVLTAASGSDADPERIKKLAEAQLKLLTGAELSQITIKGSEVAIRTKGAVSPTAAASGLAPGFSFSVPPGWNTESVWHARRIRSAPNAPDVTSALVRFPPAVAAAGNFTDALRRAWKQYIPPELVDRVSGMVFRRYVGDGLVSQFLIAQGREKGRACDSIFSLYLVDCISHWQPVVVAQIYEDPTSFASIISMMAGSSYNKSAELAEEMLLKLRCPSARNRPLIDRPGLVGDYRFGSASQLQWENVYTGSTSMTYVSYGGSLNLKADGTFTYRFTSAGGQVGAARFGKAEGSGRWSIKGDVLTAAFSKYDQGNGVFIKQHTYKVAGVTRFADGIKTLVLKSNVKQPINASTVTDRSDYYSTIKR